MTSADTADLLRRAEPPPQLPLGSGAQRRAEGRPQPRRTHRAALGPGSWEGRAELWVQGVCGRNSRSAERPFHKGLFPPEVENTPLYFCILRHRTSNPHGEPTGNSNSVKPMSLHCFGSVWKARVALAQVNPSGGTGNEPWEDPECPPSPGPCSAKSGLPGGSNASPQRRELPCELSCHQSQSESHRAGVSAASGPPFLRSFPVRGLGTCRRPLAGGGRPAASRLRLGFLPHVVFISSNCLK